MSRSVDAKKSRFHPEIAKWFATNVGEPTEVQRKAWKLISEDEHCLITAATGSGKTMAAFLWAISQLASSEWGLGQTRVLYVSPLKALNSDIRNNLLAPLAQLKEVFRENRIEWPEIRVKTRSGDTEHSERRKMLRQPPEILITTPESLNLMLASKDGQRALLGIKSVILDEIHSVVGSKRGVYLMTAIERLARLTGEFQRIALSATVRPLEEVAAFVGGFRRGVPREVKTARSDVAKRYSIEVRFPDEDLQDSNGEDFWKPIAEDLKALILANRSTLIFANSRQLCEKLTHKINHEEPEPLAYSHHGSLSKEIRTAVEKRLKNGELKAIVATNSLELGIDIGALDCVAMVQCPGAISSAIQKTGRAGHQVGAVSKAVVFPSHSRDFLEAAVLSQAIREKDIETARIVERPLDVLAQVIVSSLGPESWDQNELFDLIRCSFPYRDLSREQYDLVINMLAGRYAGSRLRELKPRVSLDRSSNTLTLRKGALLAYYFSGGVIPDRGYFHLRLSGNGARLGELDEEFVWERSIGDVFTLGVQRWMIERITYNDVFVIPAQSGGLAPPFWKSESFDRDFHFSGKIGEFLEWASPRVESKGFSRELMDRFQLDANSAKALNRFLLRQKEATKRELPHRHHILAELIDAGPSGAPGQQLVLHTHWGGRVNRPFAMALDAAWSETFGHRTEVYVSNDCVVAMMSEGVTIDEALRLVDSSNVESWLRKQLEGSGFFGARFREAAGTSLLITRQRAGQRLPLWLSRLRAKKLFESVSRYDDFPLLLEAWRSCLKDEFDMESLKQVLREFEDGKIGLSYAQSAVASPFAASVAWRQINDEYMYATDDPSAGGASNLRDDLVRAVAFDESVRPCVPEAVIQAFEGKRQRLVEGYEPSDSLELKEWLRDRIAIGSSEWDALSERVDYELDFEDEQRASRNGSRFILLKEETARVEALLRGESDLLVEWLSYYGPVSMEKLRGIVDLADDDWMALLDSLVDERRVVVGELIEGLDEACVCEAENFEILLRMNRARNRPVFKALPIEDLALFLAAWQGVAGPARDVGVSLEQMLGWHASVSDWESLLLPARLADYQSPQLDSVLVEEGLIWYGAGIGKVGFCFPEELDLLIQANSESLDTSEGEMNTTLDLRLREGRQSFAELKEATGMSSAQLENTLWSEAWAGKLSNDAFAAVRRGALGDYKLCQGENRVHDRTGLQRMRRRRRDTSAAVYPGSWFVLPERSGELDSIEELNREKERARILLDRYGIVFKELLQKEEPGFRWRDVFKALRLLELSGEIIGGQFFEGIVGLQFVSKEALRHLRRPLPRSAVFWLAANDSASISGLGLEKLKGKLPMRVSSNRLVYRGAELVLEIQRNGKALVFKVKPEDEDLPEILQALEAMMLRPIGASQVWKLEVINGLDARTSPYLGSLDARFRLYQDHKHVVIEGVR